MNSGEWLDADTAPGPTAAMQNDMVSFKFVVTNTGNVTLTNLSLTDDVFDLSVLPAPPASLAPGDSFTRIIDPAPAEFGQHVDTATVTGDFAECSKTATDTDMAYYKGAYNALTPGYWKNHPSVWQSSTYNKNTGWTAPYWTGLPLRSVFLTHGTDPSLWPILDPGRKRNIASATLVQALSFQGGDSLNGGAQILLRAGVAAVLNAQADANNANGGWFVYPLTTAEVITMVDDALRAGAGGNRQAMIDAAAILDAYNNGH